MTPRRQMDPGRKAVADHMHEVDLQRHVMTALASRGWLAFHAQAALTVVKGGGVRHRTAQLGNRGFPDIAAVHPDAHRLLIAELKSERGSVEPDQRRWLDAYRAAGAEVHLWRPRDWVNGAIQLVIAPDYLPEVSPS